MSYCVLIESYTNSNKYQSISLCWFKPFLWYHIFVFSAVTASIMIWITFHFLEARLFSVKDWTSPWLVEKRKAIKKKKKKLKFEYLSRNCFFLMIKLLLHHWEKKVTVVFNQLSLVELWYIRFYKLAGFVEAEFCNNSTYTLWTAIH